MTMAELSRRVGLSAPSTAERVKRLEEKGVLEGYAARLSPVALGFLVGAWLRIRPVPGHTKRVADIIRKLPGIVECDRITGDDCFVAKVYVRSVGELEQLLDAITPYAMTNTSIIQSSVVKSRIPPIGRGESP